MWLSFLEQFPRKLKQNSRKINAKYSMLQRRSSSRKNYFNRLSFPLIFLLSVVTCWYQNRSLLSINTWFHFSGMQTIAFLAKKTKIVCSMTFSCVCSVHTLLHWLLLIPKWKQRCCCLLTVGCHPEGCCMLQYIYLCSTTKCLSLLT